MLSKCQYCIFLNVLYFYFIQELFCCRWLEQFVIFFTTKSKFCPSLILFWRWLCVLHLSYRFHYAFFFALSAFRPVLIIMYALYVYSTAYSSIRQLGDCNCMFTLHNWISYIPFSLVGFKITWLTGESVCHKYKYICLNRQMAY